MSNSSPYLAPATRWSWKKAIFLSLAVLFVFTELALRVIHVPSVRQRLAPVAFEESRSPLQGHPYSAFTCKPNFQSSPDSKQQVSHNSFGFRGKETTWSKPKGVLRVLCVGGSSTYGAGVSSDEHTWPVQLEGVLASATEDGRFEVINLGVPGYSSFESLTRFATVGMELQPDVVVIYHGMADVRSALSNEPTPDNTHYRSNWPTTYRDGFEKALATSHVYRLLRSFTEDTHQPSTLGHVGRTHIGTDRTERGVQPARGFTNFARNIRSMIALAHSAGAEVVLISQAVDHRDLISGPNYEQQAIALRRMSLVLPQLATGEGISFVDAQATLEQEASQQIEDRGSENIFAWEDGLRDSGAKLLAMTLADAVLHVQLAQ